jgi:hypothetical protein
VRVRRSALTDRSAAAIGAGMTEFVVNSCRLRDVPVEQLDLDMAEQEVPGAPRIARLDAALHLEPEPGEVRCRLISVARHAMLVNTLARPPVLDIGFAGTQGAHQGVTELLRRHLRRLALAVGDQDLQEIPLIDDGKTHQVRVLMG